MSDKLKGRLNLHFDSLDVDGNGHVDHQDFRQRAKNVAAARGLEPGTAKHQKIVDFLDFHWGNLHRALGKGSEDSVSRDEWHAIFAAVLGDHASVNAGMKTFSDAFFDILDLDGNGYVTQSEHLAYLKSLNADTTGAAECFRKIDSDGDGRVTRQDALKAHLDFYLTDDLNSAMFILGAGAGS